MVVQPTPQPANQQPVELWTALRPAHSSTGTTQQQCSRKLCCLIHSKFKRGMFLCSRCRSQVLVCRQCDRGQIYCTGPCAQEVRRDNQRQARRRYQATPRGRTMHAERSRQYRARRQRVTDHGPATARKEESLLALRARTEMGEQLVGIKSAGHWLCHCCGQPASAFLRLSALRPEYHRRNSTKSIRRRS
jgi:hypothetical protein